MDKINLLKKIANKSTINFDDIPEKLLVDFEILNAIKINFPELFEQKEFMKLFYVHLKNNSKLLSEDDFMFLSKEHQIDKDILQKCNPDIWDWSEDGINYYKSILKKFINK